MPGSGEKPSLSCPATRLSPYFCDAEILSFFFAPPWLDHFSPAKSGHPLWTVHHRSSQEYSTSANGKSRYASLTARILNPRIFSATCGVRLGPLAATTQLAHLGFIFWSWPVCLVFGSWCFTRRLGGFAKAGRFYNLPGTVCPCASCQCQVDVCGNAIIARLHQALARWPRLREFECFHGDGRERP